MDGVITEYPAEIANDEEVEEIDSTPGTRFCPLDECEWYSKPKPNGGKKCYYGEPQCWRGWLDLITCIMRLRFSKD